MEKLTADRIVEIIEELVKELEQSHVVVNVTDLGVDHDTYSDILDGGESVIFNLSGAPTSLVIVMNHGDVWRLDDNCDIAEQIETADQVRILALKEILWDVAYTGEQD